MQTVLLARWLAICLMVLSAGDVRADSWAAARVSEVFSKSREYFVRIRPGESLGGVFGFAGAKKGRYATAEFYRRAQDRGYRLTAEVTLPNPVAPAAFLVADNGHLVTLDNWHNFGYGKVVSIYDSRGEPIRSYELADLFTAAEIRRFSHSSSSIHWRNGPAYIRQDQTTALVTVKSGADFLFGLESGQYKFCEYRDKIYRCRIANHPRQWLSNDQVPLTR